MTTIILLILLWVSPLAEWLKMLLTILFVFERLCATPNVINQPEEDNVTKDK